MVADARLPWSERPVWFTMGNTFFRPTRKSSKVLSPSNVSPLIFDSISFLRVSRLLRHLPRCSSPIWGDLDSHLQYRCQDQQRGCVNSATGVHTSDVQLCPMLTIWLHILRLPQTDRSFKICGLPLDEPSSSRLQSLSPASGDHTAHVQSSTTRALQEF